MSDVKSVVERANKMAEEAARLAEQATQLDAGQSYGAPDPFVISLSIFVLACFVGYYVVWKVTPALHTPLMAVTNAISGIIIVGAMIAVGPDGMDSAQWLGFGAVVLASINIFGGFLVTQRMLEMYKKKDKPSPSMKPDNAVKGEGA